MGKLSYLILMVCLAFMNDCFAQNTSDCSIGVFTKFVALPKQPAVSGLDVKLTKQLDASPLSISARVAAGLGARTTQSIEQVGTFTKTELLPPNPNFPAQAFWTNVSQTVLPIQGNVSNETKRKELSVGGGVDFKISPRLSIGLQNIFSYTKTTQHRFFKSPLPTPTPVQPQSPPGGDVEFNVPVTGISSGESTNNPTPPELFNNYMGVSTEPRCDFQNIDETKIQEQISSMIAAEVMLDLTQSIKNIGVKNCPKVGVSAQMGLQVCAALLNKHEDSSYGIYEPKKDLLLSGTCRIYVVIP
jgi:hypothetical protein